MPGGGRRREEEGSRTPTPTYAGFCLRHCAAAPQTRAHAYHRCAAHARTPRAHDHRTRYTRTARAHGREDKSEKKKKKKIKGHGRMDVNILIYCVCWWGGETFHCTIVCHPPTFHAPSHPHITFPICLRCLLPAPLTRHGLGSFAMLPHTVTTRYTTRFLRLVAHPPPPDITFYALRHALRLPPPPPHPHSTFCRGLGCPAQCPRYPPTPFPAPYRRTPDPDTATT